MKINYTVGQNLFLKLEPQMKGEIKPLGMNPSSWDYKCPSVNKLLFNVRILTEQVSSTTEGKYKLEMWHSPIDYVLLSKT